VPDRNPVSWLILSSTNNAYGRAIPQVEHFQKGHSPTAVTPAEEKYSSGRLNLFSDDILGLLPMSYTIFTFLKGLPVP